MKRVLLTVLKVAVSAGLIAYVILSGKIDLQNLKRLSASPVYFLSALALLTVQNWVVALRLKVLLRAHAGSPSFWSVLKLTYVGAFFDTVSITSVGGDAIKAYYLSREAPAGHRTESVSVMLVDRLLGMTGLLTLALISAAWSVQVLWSEQALRPYLTGLLIVCGVLMAGAGLLFSRRVQEWPPLQRVLNALPLGHMLARAHLSMRAFRTQPFILVEGWLLAVVVHVISALTCYLLALGLFGTLDFNVSGAPIHVETSLFFVAFLMSNFVSSFAPFGAIGVGQVAYAFVFQHIAQLPYGADLATAMQLAFILTKAPGFIPWLAAKNSALPPDPTDKAIPASANIEHEMI